MKVTAEFAEEHIAHLFAIAGQGEEVQIAVPNGPTLKLAATVAPAPERPRGPRILGAGRGEVRVPSEEEWREHKEQMALLMNDAPLMTSGEI
jgi:antitoxin (DNA-binding transcriptional repressor) of toxin-antitoxin stability system